MNAVVIGGGFSGAMTAVHLARRGIASSVIEPGPLGRGLAYGAGTSYLLNTPTHAMSALDGEPEHFAAYLHRRDAYQLFASRAVYGDYLEDTIATLGREHVTQVRARAVGVERTRTGYAVRCDDGRVVHGNRLVLALGNAAPRRPAAVAADEPRYLHEPYRGLDRIGADDAVAVLGTSLTAIDVIAALRARGHRGKVLAVSRRGLLPEAHAVGRTVQPAVVPRELVRQPRLRSLVAWWRSRIERDVEIAALVAGLRPVIPVLWARLPLADRRAFLRHVRPHWDIVRHRVPPTLRSTIETLIADGALRVTAGRLAATHRTSTHLQCVFATGTGELSFEASWLVNCTGPERDLARMACPFVRDLCARGLVSPDPLGLGVATSSAGAVMTANGPSPDAFVVGPWRAGDLWETTAVPELRVQARLTAEAIVRSIGASRDQSSESRSLSAPQ